MGGVGLEILREGEGENTLPQITNTHENQFSEKSKITFSAYATV